MIPTTPIRLPYKSLWIFWLQLRRFARETMIGAGVISPEDITFVHPAGSVEEAMSFIRPR